MEECSVVDCENDAVEGETQCEECLSVSNRLSSVFKEKTKEIVIDGELYV